MSVAHNDAVIMLCFNAEMRILGLEAKTAETKTELELNSIQL